MPRTKAKLNEKAQAALVRWIEDALGENKRATFVDTFKIKGFTQTTFNRDVGPAGRFTEQRAREICRAIKRSYDELPGEAVDRPAKATGCDYRCGLFHGINAGISANPNEIEVRKRASWQIEGSYKIVFRFVAGHDKAYGVAFKACACGAVLFDYVQDDDPVPDCSHGFALIIGEMMTIYMIGEGVNWTLACHVPRVITRRPLTGIILDPNPRTSQIEANKFVLVKSGTPVAASLTDEKIARLLDNATGAANGSLVSVRE